VGAAIVARVTGRLPPRARHVWERSGVHVWFHYTTLEHAREIGAQRRYVVSTRPHQRVGSGLFLTNVEPNSMDEAEMLKDLFAYQRPADVLQGVIVLARNDALLPTERCGHRQWIHHAEPGVVLDLTNVFLGYGLRNEFNGEWIFSDGLHIPAK
jgi:hypothetical protein